MVLAAISFSDPVMLIGLLAAGLPVALHLLNRVRSPIVPFPTLRFLKITAQKTSRRRQVQQYFLLLVRMAVFAMIAMAVAHPLIRGGSATAAYSFIAMFLLGIALLVLAGVWGSAAIDSGKGRTAQTGGESVAMPTRAPGTSRYWGLSAVALLLAIGFAGYSVFGLSSNTYFSGDKGEFSGRSTAAVVLFDNSHSMLARQDAVSRLELAKKETRRLLVEAIRPAQAAVLATNPGSNATAETLTGDMTTLVGYLDKLEPAGRARPVKDRIHSAADLLAQSTQPNKMLIVVSDMAQQAFADAEVFSGLKESGAKDVQVILMPMGAGSPPADVGIASFAIAEGGGAAVVGNEVMFEAQILNNGDAANVKELELLVDDQPVESVGVGTRVQLGPAATGSARATIKIPYRLDRAGPHAFTLRLKDSRDAMAWDDSRTLVLDVAEQVRVLVIGADATARGPRSRSAAFFFDAALAPFEGLSLKDANGKPMAWSIQPTYRSAEDIGSPSDLSGYAAVFVCDVPKIAPRMADALARYAAAGDGGRIIWVLGPSVDGAAYNQVLVNRGLLPAPLAEPVVSAAGSTIDWVDLQSDVFANLFDDQEPFRAAVVTGRWGFAAGDIKGRALGKLADGHVILTQHNGPGGVGEIYTLLTSPSAAWSNLGSTVLLVPMASRMALGDSGRSRTPSSYESGDNLLIRVPGADGNAQQAKLTLDVTTPTKATVNARPVMSGTSPRWYFDQTLVEGLYRWRSSDGKSAGMFAVNPPAEEADLHPAEAQELAREAGIAAGATAGHSPIVASTADELLAQLDKRSEGTTLTPGVLAIVMILAVLEALMANRYRPAAPIESSALKQAHSAKAPRAAA